MKLVIALLTALAAASIFAYRMHSRTVLSGSFYDLQIGSDKLDVVKVLSRKPITAVSSYETEVSVINSDNINEIGQLVVFDGIRVRAPNFLGEIFLTGGVVDGTYIAYGGDILLDVMPGASFSEIEEVLRKILNDSPQASIFGSTKGYGENNSKHSVDLQRMGDNPGGAGVNWLVQQDVWTFNTQKGYKRFVLTFRRGYLSEIDYKNYFVELP